MKKRPKGKEGNQERWLLTYADLITLLMIFFVVMYALSQVDLVKFKQLAGALAGVFGGGRSQVGEYQGTSTIPLPAPSNANLQAVVRNAEDLLTQPDLRNQSSAVVKENEVVITLQANLIFQPGEAAIAPRANQHLVAIGKLLGEMPNSVRVEGYTDNVPIRSNRYPSNWQLSAERAANIAQLLSEQAGIPPERISAVGYGSSHPIADNNTALGRARNRRVAIVMEGGAQ